MLLNSSLYPGVSGIQNPQIFKSKATWLEGGGDETPCFIVSKKAELQIFKSETASTQLKCFNISKSLQESLSLSESSDKAVKFTYEKKKIKFEFGSAQLAEAFMKAVRGEPFSLPQQQQPAPLVPNAPTLNAPLHPNAPMHFSPPPFYVNPALQYQQRPPAYSTSHPHPQQPLFASYPHPNQYPLPMNHHHPLNRSWNSAHDLHPGPLPSVQVFEEHRPPPYAPPETQRFEQTPSPTRQVTPSEEGPRCLSKPSSPSDTASNGVAVPERTPLEDLRRRSSSLSVFSPPQPSRSSVSSNSSATYLPMVNSTPSSTSPTSPDFRNRSSSSTVASPSRPRSDSIIPAQAKAIVLEEHKTLGFGFAVVKIGDKLMVSFVSPRSPAYYQGLLAARSFVEGLNGESVTGLTPEQFYDRCKGASKVTLHVCNPQKGQGLPNYTDIN